jgi:hypothetical protein
MMPINQQRGYSQDNNITNNMVRMGALPQNRLEYIPQQPMHQPAQFNAPQAEIMYPRSNPDTGYYAAGPQAALQMAPPNAPRRGAGWSGIQMSTSLDQTLQGNPDAFQMQGGAVQRPSNALQGGIPARKVQKTKNPQSALGRLLNL